MLPQYENELLISVVFNYDNADPSQSGYYLADQTGEEINLEIAPDSAQVRFSRDLGPDEVAKYEIGGKGTLTYTGPLNVSPLGYFTDGYYSVIDGNSRLLILQDKASENIERFKAICADADSGSAELARFYKEAWKIADFKIMVYTAETVADPSFLIQLAATANAVAPLNVLDRALAYSRMFTLIEADYQKRSTAGKKKVSKSTVHRETAQKLGWAQNLSNAGYFFLKLAEFQLDPDWKVWIDAVRDRHISAYALIEKIRPAYLELAAKLEEQEAEPLSITEFYNECVKLAPVTVSVGPDGEELNNFTITENIANSVLKTLAAMMLVGGDGDDEEEETAPSRVEGDAAAAKRQEREKIEGLKVDELDAYFTEAHAKAKAVLGSYEGEFDGMKAVSKSLDALTTHWPNFDGSEKRKALATIGAIALKEAALMTTLDNFCASTGDRLIGLKAKSEARIQAEADAAEAEAAIVAAQTDEARELAAV